MEDFGNLEQEGEEKAKEAIDQRLGKEGQQGDQQSGQNQTQDEQQTSQQSQTNNS